jgi:ADP-dependent NAD(P)H-hydrate dehydratase / NAD(P)H-hydrate epimerase
MDRLPDGALMGRAAAGLASVCATLLGQVYGARIAILAGSGDNGGDALFAGAILARRGASVTAIAAADRIHELGAAELRGAGGRLLPATSAADGTPGGRDATSNSDTTARAGATAASSDPAGGSDPAGSSDPAGNSDTPGRSGRTAGRAGADGQGARGGMSAAVADALDRADLIIDGLLGIGGRGGLREPAATLAWLTELARAEGSMVVAVDLPSGVDADTGVVAGPAIRADVTVTFGTWKPGLLIDPGASYAGTAELIDIGLGPELGAPSVGALQAPDIAAILPQPTAESNKYRRGVLGVLAGSQQYSGAAVLATGSAIHGGAGMVRLVSSEAVLAAARQHWPEAVMSVADPAAPAESIKAAGRVQAWTAGPGMGTGEDSAGLLAAVLATSLPVLVDADGITILAAHRELLDRSAPTLITPHSGELARLTGADIDSIEARRLEHATKAADDLGVTVLLKGSTTVIAEPGEQPVLVNSTGSSWLATAGSGDVLSGLAGALLAQGIEAPLAAAVAAYLHGIAGRLAARDAPIGASDLITALPEAIRTITRTSP